MLITPLWKLEQQNIKMIGDLNEKTSEELLDIIDITDDDVITI